MSDSNSDPKHSRDLTADELFRAATECFKIHVDYRAAMLRYLLVASGILAVAYVRLLTTENGKSVAFVLAILGGIVTLAFVVLEMITNTKIQNAKSVICAMIREGSTHANDWLLALYGGDSENRLDEGFQMKVLQDPIWISVAQATLIGGFAMGAAHASDCCLSTVLTVGGVAAAFVFVFGITLWLVTSNRPTG